jgi:phage major head subunit gpT-like protein
MDVETRMRIVSTHEYDRLNALAIWPKIAKRAPMSGRKERLLWLLDTAQIEYVNRLGGEVQFEDILSNTVEYETKAATAGLRLNRFDLEDKDAGGVQMAAHWARQMGEYAAYWPEKQILKALNAGALSASKSYDNVSFFSASHPLNPFDTSLGNYPNLFTGAPSAGVTPGACPINGVSTEVALENLARAVTFVESAYKMPNGEDPRRLRVSGILAPTALKTPLTKALDSKFIAAATGGGSLDPTAVVSMLGLGQPLFAPELGANFTNGSDTAYYLIADNATSDMVGGLTYYEREPFSIVYNGEMTDAQLARANELQWLTRGRNVVTYGHPYMIFKVLAT